MYRNFPTRIFGSSSKNQRYRTLPIPNIYFTQSVSQCALCMFMQMQTHFPYRPSPCHVCVWHFSLHFLHFVRSIFLSFYFAICAVFFCVSPARFIATTAIPPSLSYRFAPSLYPSPPSLTLPDTKPSPPFHSLCGGPFGGYSWMSIHLIANQQLLSFKITLCLEDSYSIPSHDHFINYHHIAYI